MIGTEEKYRQCVRAWSAAERVRRAESLFNWSRDFLARSIARSSPDISETELRWEIALRQFGSDPAFRELVRECRHRASA